MSSPPNTQPQRPSRILAALDDSYLPSNTPNGTVGIATPPNIGLKRKLPTTINEAVAESIQKRRAVSNDQSSDAIMQNAVPGSSSGAHLPSVLSRLAVSPRRTSMPPASGIVNFGLNYDNETPVHRIDIGGQDQQVRMAEFVTKSIDNLSHGLSVQDAMKRLGLSNKKDLLPGLEVRLLPHQIIGVSWMLEQERKTQYKGGILADDMGLGKTVQMIAMMAMNLPDLDDPCRTSLIVVPAALLQQWNDEIEAKSNGIFTVHVHHGKDKLKSLSNLRSKDVVITTYQTLNSDFAVPADIENDEEMEWLAENGGLLARMKWYRAILDEAQFIRNRGTRSSRSVAMLRAKYRWMLTGTPVTNTLADIYGLIRFGRFRPWNDWNDFNEYIAKQQQLDAPLAGMRAQEVLKPLLLRRTKDSTLEGEPILQLPPKDIELVKLDFSDEERDLYDSFEKKANIRLSKFIKQGTVVKNNAAILAMILRLRQLCCHPNLILSLAEGYEDPTLLVGSDSDKELGRAKKIMGAAWVAGIQKIFLTRAVAAEVWDFADEGDEPEAACGACHDLFMNDSGRVLACGHEVCFDCLLEITNSPPSHDGIFGYGTEQENIKAEKEWEAAAAKGFRPCPTCKKMNDPTPAKVFKSSAFEPSDEDLVNGIRAKKRQNATRRRGRRAMSVDSDEDVKMVSPSPRKSGAFIDLADSSDDELPDMAQLLAGRGSTPVKKNKRMRESNSGSTQTSKSKSKGKSRQEEDDDVVDLTMNDISTDFPTPSKAGKNLNSEPSNDTDIEASDSSPKPSPRKTPSTHRQRSNISSESPRSVQRSDKALQKKGKAKEGSDGGPSAAVIETWRNGDDDLEPSTKMLALVNLLKEWDASGDKSICFSQWTCMLDLVEKLFSRYGIRSLRYDGKMDRQSRDSALATFKKMGGPKVILISTRCGGIGLNLVAANRVVNLDLSWNYAAESQAYDRVHRLGQEKDVFVKRLVVRDTIEERMLQLQDLKVGLAEAALGEGTGVKLHKMSVKEIKLLFGMGPKKDGERRASGGGGGGGSSP